MPSPTPFEINDTSALSLHKKQSSTYSKYACGCFLCAPSICIVYFKRLTEGHLLRDAQKQMLNVSEPPRMAGE